jgi:hypothetical protein
MKAIPYILAGAIGLSIGGGAYMAIRDQGVQQERARVVIQAKKTDAKAQKARTAVAAKPLNSVLDGQYRD